MALSPIHHIVPQYLFGTGPNGFSSLLSSINVGINAAANLIILPSDPAVAQALGITVHNGGHLASYTGGIRAVFEQIESRGLPESAAF
jgi:A nuclease family of the HNH/ENDO VII superfamily with conserved AHH